MVPSESIQACTPRDPVFFNPRARLSRDLSLAAYGAFADGYSGHPVFLEGLSGTGARGLRVANELGIDAVINDINSDAIGMARESAGLNGISCAEFSEDEACRFFSAHSSRGMRGSVVDVDPFGSPVAFFDCALRATTHGGMLSCTATDQQVLHGLFDDACKRKYGGVPADAEYGNETAMRLVLGCLASVAGRLGMEIEPLFAESNIHYYRSYVTVSKRPASQGSIGFIMQCGCGHRWDSGRADAECPLCGAAPAAAGPLWTGRLHDGEFVGGMMRTAPRLAVDGRCAGILEKAYAEAAMPAAYYTLDEIAARLKASPPKLERIIKGLQDAGFASSPTAFCPTGFRTNATAAEVMAVFSKLAGIAKADTV